MTIATYVPVLSRGTIAGRAAKSRPWAFWFRALCDAVGISPVRPARQRTADLCRPRGKAPQGKISLVGAGPGARDLLTLRAVNRLQEADVIYYDRLVDAEVLDLARPDAERVYVGKVVGACAWPQDRICGLIVRDALQRPPGGAAEIRRPGGFWPRDRGNRRGPRPCDPGRDRGGHHGGKCGGGGHGAVTDPTRADRCVVLATGTCQPGDALPDWARHARPGTTLAIYMGIGQIDTIVAQLLVAGADPTDRAQVAFDVEKPTELLIESPLADLAARIAATGRKRAGLILVTLPKTVQIQAPARLASVLHADP